MLLQTTTSGPSVDSVALRAWVLHELPRLNVALDAGTMPVTDFAQHARSALATIRPEDTLTLARLPRTAGCELLHLVGFLACSIEHHTQQAGREPGEGLALVPGLEDALAALSVAAKLPPNLGLHGYWLANRDAEPLSFTGDDQERFFRRMVVEINELHERTAALLRPLTSGRVALTDPAAAKALERAAALQGEVHECYRGFRVRGARDQFQMTIAFFRDVMRTYLVSFPVHGTTWHGPNAANVAAQASVDFLIGIVVPEYVSHVSERMNYLTDEERDQVREDLRAASVLARLLAALGLKAADVETMDEAALGAVLAHHPDLADTLRAFARFERAAGGASGAHFGLILTYLGKGDATADGTQRAVDAGHGTGGRTHEQTKRVMEMRNRHPVARKLSKVAGAAR